jgi:hypothetical protein
VERRREELRATNAKRLAGVSSAPVKEGVGRAVVDRFPVVEQEGGREGLPRRGCVVQRRPPLAVAAVQASPDGPKRLRRPKAAVRRRLTDHRPPRVPARGPEGVGAAAACGGTTARARESTPLVPGRQG